MPEGRECIGEHARISIGGAQKIEKSTKMSIKSKGKILLLLQFLSLKCMHCLYCILYDMEFLCKLKGHVAGIWDILKGRK